MFHEGGRKLGDLNLIKPCSIIDYIPMIFNVRSSRRTQVLCTDAQSRGT